MLARDICFSEDFAAEAEEDMMRKTKDILVENVENDLTNVGEYRQDTNTPDACP